MRGRLLEKSCSIILDSVTFDIQNTIHRIHFEFIYRGINKLDNILERFGPYGNELFLV